MSKRSETIKAYVNANPARPINFNSRLIIDKTFRRSRHKKTDNCKRQNLTIQYNPRKYKFEVNNQSTSPLNQGSDETTPCNINNYLKTAQKQNENDQIERKKKDQPRLTFGKYMIEDNLVIIKNILDNYNLKWMKYENYQKIVNTYGLKIESLKCPTYQKSKEQKIILINPTMPKITKAVSKKNTENISLQYRTTKSYSKIQKLVSQIEKPQTPQYHRMGQQRDFFEIRLKKYRDYLFIVNLSNRIYRQLKVQQYSPGITYFIGIGNNSNLIRAVLKKRVWMRQIKDISKANFIWTQIKVQEIFKGQQNNTIKHKQQNLVQLKFTDSSPSKKGPKLFEPIDPLLKLLTETDYLAYGQTLQKLKKKKKEDYQTKIKLFSKQLRHVQNTQHQRIHNHLPNNGVIGNKKAMFYCLVEYCQLLKKKVFQIVPHTFHIKSGQRDPQFKKFIQIFEDRKKLMKSNIWIIKPGEYTNRGQGIFCTNKIQKIRKAVSQHSQGEKTYIIQEYLTRPCLYHQRKFDIRAYILITSSNGILKAYWYQEGYIRTSSSKFDLNDLQDCMIHLTNDAIQKNNQSYGKYEEGNKLSYSDLHRYLDTYYKNDFFLTVYPEMRRIASEAVRATFHFLDIEKKQHNFQIFGLDFMLDQNCKPWLLQINTNPCFQLGSAVQQRVIPYMVENAMRIGLDSTFPPPSNGLQGYAVSQNCLSFNKFELIFDQLRDGQSLKMLYKKSKIKQEVSKVKQQQQIYQDEGQEMILQEW